MKKLLFSAFVLSLSLANAQDCSELFFSEYVEGTGQNKALEIYNPTSSQIDLSAYKIVRHSNGSIESDESILSGNIAAHDVIVITNGSNVDEGYGVVDPELWDKGDLRAGAYPTPLHMNGNDAITLEKLSGEKLDIIGKVGQDPGDGSGWSDEAPDYIASYYKKAWTKDHTMVRKSTVKKGATDFSISFNPAAEFDSLSVNTFDSLGFHNCACNSNNVSVSEETFTFLAYAKNGVVTISSKELVNTVSLIDLNGKEMFSTDVKNSNFVITPNLVKGIYLISLTGENGVVVTSKIKL